MKLSFDGPSGFLAAYVWKYKSERPWTKVNNDLNLYLTCIHVPILNYLYKNVSSQTKSMNCTNFLFIAMQKHWSKVDLAIKQVMVNQGSSFEQILWGPLPQCCIPSLKVISLLILEKILKGISPNMGMVAILVIWPGPSEHAFLLPTHISSVWNLASVGLSGLKPRR